MSNDTEHKSKRKVQSISEKYKFLALQNLTKDVQNPSRIVHTLPTRIDHFKIKQ